MKEENKSKFKTIQIENTILNELKQYANDDLEKAVEDAVTFSLRNFQVPFDDL